MSAENNFVKELAQTIYSKNKRSFRHFQNELIRQAKYFSIEYREFILKVISSPSIKIRNTYKGGYMIPSHSDLSIDNLLRKKAVCKIFTRIKDVTTLPHEIGHSIDFYFGVEKALSVVVLIDGFTLYEIFTKEFNEKKEELYQLVMDEYKNIVNSNINDKAFDILCNNMELYRELESLPINKKDVLVTKRRKQIHETFLKNGFAEVYYQFYIRNCWSILNTKYSPILDALSSEHDFSGLFLDHHDINYYQCSKYNAVQEFFANCFEALVTSRFQYIEHLEKYLPKSFSAFKKIVEIFYERIMNNKRFLDVPVFCAVVEG